MKAQALAALGLLFAGCAGTALPEEEITYSDDWFACESRFDCVAIEDAFCEVTAVNSRYTLVYQDWSRQQAAKFEESVPCPPRSIDQPFAAACRQNRCETR